MAQSPKFQIIAVGSPIVDSLAHVPESFIAGIAGKKGGMELVDASTMQSLLSRIEGDVHEAPGGSAGNTVFTIARLGLPATFLGKIGNDQGGDFYYNSFLRMGGDGSRFKKGNVPNGRCLSLITPDSERTMRTDLGAAMTLTPEEISVADFQDCRHAHIEGYLLFNRNLMQRVLECAHAAGCTISLDLASFEVVEASKDILPDLLEKYIDIVFANEEEASAFTGIRDDHEAQVKKLGDYCETAVVKIGKRGSLVFNAGELIRIQPEVVQAVDTTGAGDLWAAGFLFGWLQGKPLSECGRYGSILGAEIVQVLGGSIPQSRWPAVRSKLGLD